tara:strand:- start:302 stop:964 length:663 start_codon:yes stop_codon:yes gene_type:complete
MVIRIRHCIKTGLLVGFIWCINVTATAGGDSAWHAPAVEAEKINPVRYDVESVTVGKQLFADHCQACHGYWGEGNGVIGLTLNNQPANLLRIAGKQSPGAFAWKIATGRNVMPAFRDVLSEEQIWHVVNFITSLENEIGSAGQTAIIRRCATCHGLEGRAVYPEWPDLGAMSQEDIERKLYAHRSGVIDDSTMSKVTVDLTDDEIKEAARYYSSLKDQQP